MCVKEFTRLIVCVYSHKQDVQTLELGQHQEVTSQTWSGSLWRKPTNKITNIDMLLALETVSATIHTTWRLHLHQRLNN